MLCALVVPIKYCFILRVLSVTRDLEKKEGDQPTARQRASLVPKSLPSQTGAV